MAGLVPAIHVEAASAAQAGQARAWRATD